LHPDLETYTTQHKHTYWDGRTEERDTHVSLTPKIRTEREKCLYQVLKKLSKKNINIISTDATDTHTIINYEVLR